MSRILPLVAGATLLAAVTACGGGSTAGAPATVTVTAPASTTTTSSTTTTTTAAGGAVGFLTEVHAGLGDTHYAYIGDDKLLDLGNTMCEAIDNGASRNQFGTLAEQSEIPPQATSVLLKAATTHLCPQHAGF